MRYRTAWRLGIAGSAALAMMITVADRPTRAFFPTSTLSVGGLLGRSHAKITSDAVKELDNEFFGITDLTDPMEKAIEQIADANAEVDQDQFTSAKHVDGESFPEGQTRLTSLRQGVVNALATNDATGARSSLGQALHTIQDFYSHSNWIELGNGAPHPALGRGGAIARLAANVPTCRACTGGLPPVLCPDCSANLLTGSLTSGYYSGEDRVKPNAQKCSHGGFFDGSSTGFFGEGINKDSIDCEFSPHNGLHGAAASVAKDATKQFIRDIRDLITPRQLKLLLGVGPTLAISIDTTGSMGSIIASVRAQAIAIVNSRLNTDQEPSKYVLAPFNDPSVGPTTVTTDPDVFKGAISGLFASGGGDCPELSMSGMLQALTASDEGGDLFMFTDASALDAGLAGAVSSLAVAKDIKVYPITFGSCSPIDPAYLRIAADSGGQVFQLQFSESATIAQLADLLLRTNAVRVLSADLEMSGTPRTFPVPVDSTLTRLVVSVTGTTDVTLTRPSGAIVAPGDPDVTIINLSSGRILSFNAPAPGEWDIGVNGVGPVNVAVSGESPIDLTAFRFVRLAGRPGHQGLMKISGLPQAGADATIHAFMKGAFETATFQLRERDGDVSMPLALTRLPADSDNEFIGTLVMPGDPVLAYVTGQDPNGFAYQRTLPEVIRAQHVIITPPVGRDLVAGESTIFSFQVKNLGGSDTFQFAATDNRRFITQIGQTTATIDTNQTVTVPVTLTVPPGTPEGVSDTITFTVQSLTNGASFNFSVLSTVVARPSGGLMCDADLDTDIDAVDIQRILDGRNTQAASGDPRDANRDGLITLSDSRLCTARCTRPQCAP